MSNIKRFGDPIRDSLKMNDFVKHYFIFGTKNKTYIQKTLRKLDIFNFNLNLNSFNNESFLNLKELVKESENQNVLLLKSNVKIYNKIYENIYFAINNLPSNFDIVVYGIDGNIIFNDEYRLIFNLPNIWNFNTKQIDKKSSINEVYCVVLSKNFIESFNENVDSLEDLLIKAINNDYMCLCVNPYLFLNENIKNNDYSDIQIKNNNLYEFQHSGHLGDSVFMVTFFNKLLEKYSDININYYINHQIIPEIEKLKTSNRLQLFNVNDPNSKNLEMIGVGFGANVNEVCFNNNYNFSGVKKFYFNKNLIDFFNIHDFKFNDDDTFYTNKINDSFKEYEYLLINSYSMALNFTLEIDKLDKLFEKLADKLASRNISFITTKKIKNYPCTLEEAPNLIDIFNLSQKVKNIIAIDTAPLSVAFNKNNMYKLNSVIYLNQNGWNYNNYNNTTRISNLIDFENYINLYL